MPFHEGNDVIAEIPAPSRPLVVRPAAVMIGTVEPTARIRRPQPFERLLVAGVHPEGDLRLAPVTTEMALSDQQTDQEPSGEVIRGP